jgi:signal transduction histidine kinase
MSQTEAESARRRWRRPLLAAAYIVLHVLLDAVSSTHDLAYLSITPWNPPSGLALVLFLLVGWRFVPVVFIACLLSDLMVLRWDALHVETSLVYAASFSFFFCGCASILRLLKIQDGLNGMRDILLLVLTGSLGGLLVGLAHAGNLVLMGYLAPERFIEALVRSVMGDVLSIITNSTLLLVVWQHRTEAWPEWREWLAPVLAGFAVSWVVFGFESTDEFKYFYLLFLPLIWMAVLSGLKGAVTGIAIIKISMMYFTSLLFYEVATITALQALMLTLALTALLLGAVVDERKRAQAKLHEHQASLVQMSRLSLAGEMASGLAHELNQPLTAIVNYIKAAQGLLNADSLRQDEVSGALDKASSQAMRASQIIVRLREFLQKGELELEEIAVGDLVGEALSLIAPTLKRRNIRLSVNIPSDLPLVRADRIHAEQVLLNLIVNAIEAQDEIPGPGGEIQIFAAAVADGMIEIAVKDQGPGIDPELAGRLFEPFATSKTDGMGLGLMICRSIAEAHGGKLWHDAEAGDATIFRFTLPRSVPETSGD